MTIEILYPEFCMMYGDRANITIIEEAFKEAKIVKTHFKDKPKFTDSKPDLIYIGSMAETNLEMVLEELSNYKKELKAYVEDNGYLLVTGNAADIFGQTIVQNNSEIKGLEIFDYSVTRNLRKRNNCIFLGIYKDIDIVGNKTQFTLHFGEFKNPFIKVVGGFGSNREVDTEGIHYKNSFVTTLHGPFLVLNPLFTKHLFKELGFTNTLPYESELLEGYNFRLNIMKQDGAIFQQDDHGR